MTKLIINTGTEESFFKSGRLLAAAADRGEPLPSSVPGSLHLLKYSLALIIRGVCVLRYDNEAGKGDHKHIGDVEMPYSFTTPADLIADFWRDVDLLEDRK